jgi:hypothetical protein
MQKESLSQIEKKVQIRITKQTIYRKSITTKLIIHRLQN